MTVDVEALWPLAIKPILTCPQRSTRPLLNQQHRPWPPRRTKVQTKWMMMLTQVLSQRSSFFTSAPAQGTNLLALKKFLHLAQSPAQKPSLLTGTRVPSKAILPQKHSSKSTEI
jgi:hypothetical protein